MSKCTREDECDACYYKFGFQSHEFGIKCWMGPVARELREWANHGACKSDCLDESVWRVFDGAMLSLGLLRNEGCWRDTMSEAIEAAEALGL